MLEDIFNREIKLKMGIFILLIAALIISTAVIGFLISKNESEIIVSKSGNDETTNSDASTLQVNTIAEKNENSEKIQVYVVGEVNKPGVVNIFKGQIIDDAIKAAGGPTDKADLENINLAYVLQKNVMLKVLPKNKTNPDITSQSKIENGGISEGTPIQSKSPNMAFSGIEISSDSKGAVLEEAPNKDKSNDKININTATQAELETLPGVGTSTASKIISFRQKSGDFKKIEDIMNVTGIGENKFSDMKEFICVD